MIEPGVQENRFYAVLKISKEIEGYIDGNKCYLFQKFIEFECLDVEGRDLDKAGIRLHNKAALRSTPQ
jgi:hypothetical protein